MEIQLYEQKPDWQKIIRMALDRQDWGKTFTLYDYKGASVICNLHEFNFTHNEAKFKLKVNYLDKTSKLFVTDMEFVDYKMNHFSIKDFERILNNRIIKLLENCIEEETKRKAEIIFADSYLYKQDIGEDIIGEMNLLDEYNVIINMDNENLRDKCLNDLFRQIQDEQNEPYYRKISDYITHNPVHIPGFNTILKRLKNE
ncbi:MAG: hypothetical protein R6U15_06520 [Candidatus Izemoplasmatales bacterium]